jgi:hypothetical protein
LLTVLLTIIVLDVSIVLDLDIVDQPQFRIWVAALRAISLYPILPRIIRAPDVLRRCQSPLWVKIASSDLSNWIQDVSDRLKTDCHFIRPPYKASGLRLSDQLARIIDRTRRSAVRGTVHAPLFRDRRSVCRAPESGTPYGITHAHFAIVPHSAGI